MGDSSVKKIDAAFSPHGSRGQKYLVSGKRVSLRLWEENASIETEQTSREYETVGYVIQGRAELYTEGQKILLEPGQAWLVPPGAEHYYWILEPFVALEATSPPSQVHGRDV